MTLEGKRPDLLVHSRDPDNAETPGAVLAAGDLTASEAFYVRNHGPIPQLDPGSWRLRVDGLVTGELELSLDDLQARFEPGEITATLVCAGNRRAALLATRDIPGEHPWRAGAIGTAIWRGIRLADLLDAVGLRAQARHIAFTGADHSEQAEPPQPFGASIPREKALGPEVLLAWEMNGRPLPTVHGAPLRAVVPGYIGARSVKWLTRITALREPSANYFQSRSYRLLTPETDPATAPAGTGIALGPLAVNGDILVPDDGTVVSAGALELIGYALAGEGCEVVRVDVSIDAGEHWQQAELLGPASPWAWRRWRTVLTLPRGRRRIVARVWDSAAATQPEDPARLWNPKGYVNNAWARIDLQVE